MNEDEELKENFPYFYEKQKNRSTALALVQEDLFRLNFDASPKKLEAMNKEKTKTLKLNAKDNNGKDDKSPLDIENEM